MDYGNHPTSEESVRARAWDPSLRRTRQRDAIANVFAQTDRALSAREILALAQAEVEDLGMATVYRQLKVLVDLGRVVVLELPHQPLHYELTGRGPHHHFLCRSCQRVYQLKGSQARIQAMKPAGFLLEGYSVILYGRCQACAADTAEV